MTDLHTENARLRAALIDVTASLFAAISLLSRGSKKAAPSDKMFDQMVVDYETSAERARALLAAPAPDAVQEAARVLLSLSKEAAQPALDACHGHYGQVAVKEFLRAIAGDRT